jgi:hypothetical protein
VPIPRKFTNWFLAIVVLAAALTYLCDFLYLGLKMANKNSTEAFGTIQFFPATQLKNGKLDIYIESPQTETCVHALFPHYGYNPCWYAKRNQVHVVAQRIKSESSAGVPAGNLRAQIRPRHNSRADQTSPPARLDRVRAKLAISAFTKNRSREMSAETPTLRKS